MLNNYLKIALRNLKRHKGYAFINIVGLAVGMACALLILVFVEEELRYDRFHENADRLYRVARTTAANTPYPLAPALAADFPDVARAVRVYDNWQATVRRGTEVFIEPNFFFADPDVFEVFSFPFLRGDPATALAKPNALVLTETMAHKYFGDEDPIGQSLTIDGIGDLTVTGVLEDLPATSHLQFDYLGSFRYKETADAQFMQSWVINSSVYTYVLLKEGYTPEGLAAKFPAFVERRIGDQAASFPGDYTLALQLQPVTDIHLHSALQMEVRAGGDIAYVYGFSAIAVFILLIACINFMNLTTARSTNRAKEVGMRKTIGAQRRQLIGQFLTESILMALVAAALALLIAELSLPLFNAISGKSLSVSYLNSTAVWPKLVGLALVVGLLAGSYPAFFLSSFQPATVLKGLAHRGKAGERLRKGLVIVQYTIAVALIIGTAVVYSQLQFIQNKKLGFDKEQVVAVTIQDHPIQERIEALQEALQRDPALVNATVSSDIPGQRVIGDWLYRPEGADPNDEAALVGLVTLMVDPEFVETMGLQLLEGRNLSRDHGTDQSAFLINETAARRLGWEDPLGKRLEWYTFTDDGAIPAKEGPVVGILKDFHFYSLHEPIQPIVLQLEPGREDVLSVRLQAGDLRNGLAALLQHWQAFTGESSVRYTFLDANVSALYRAESRLSQIILTFSTLAILIACLGLFGLASFTAQQRTKEIGVRKVLGATVPGLVLLLSKDVAKLVVFALVLAGPLAYFIMERWLTAFAYRIGISWQLFLVAGLAALVIALLTVSYQSIKAARTNPVDALRYE